MAKSEKPDYKVLEKIIGRAHYFATQMIHIANNRSDKEKGDPKIGGHPAACASALHILSAIHLVVKSGFDHMAVKPHASPTDHSLNYLLDLLLDKDFKRLAPELAETAMHGLRKYPHDGEPVFQSYHSAYDSDHHNFFPSGTVGIPPVKAGYLAHAYRFAADHGYDVPKDAHFWSLIGDSEFREGSLFEAIPDFAERQIGNLTWIVDYNRQSLDGHRITNKKIMSGTDAVRIEKTMLANGWEVIQVQHGKKRKKVFALKGGDSYQRFLEDELEDYEFQALLLIKDVKLLRDELSTKHPQIKDFIKTLSDTDLYESLRDLGGHDLESLVEALEQSKKDREKPTMIIAHTLKGWGLENAAAQGNHSSLPDESEVDRLRDNQGLSKENVFGRFDKNSPEGQFLKRRGEKLYNDILEQNNLKERNKQKFLAEVEKHGTLPDGFDINLKMVNYPHTQWMLGQITAKLTRISNTSWDEKQLKEKQRALTPEEKPLKLPGELLVSMAPDVGTSTNLNPAMDGKIFSPIQTQDFESEFEVKDTKLPDLIPGEEESDRFLRFEIAEGNVMSCVGAYGKMRDILGIPLMPLMTVYDFFIKRALDQYFYNLYWKSSFILVGTPAGVTLSPEGAQHGWKSDIQIPNQITWEPFYCIELEWIMADAMKRHLTYDNEGRQGVLIRGTTRGIEQKDFINRLKRQKRFKVEDVLLSPQGMNFEGAADESTIATHEDSEIFKAIREDLLQGAYYLIDYRGYANYEPGDNVVNIFAMGPMGTEALKASDELLKRGIYANVIMIPSPDLLIGIQAHENNYHHLKNNLGINSNLYLNRVQNGSVSNADLITVSGRRIPIVSVHDGEPGLLDNIGSIVGVRHESLAVRKHSKCGRPTDVYHFHHIDAEAIVEASGKMLSETALEAVYVGQSVLTDIHNGTTTISNWRELWPELNK